MINVMYLSSTGSARWVNWCKVITLASNIAIAKFQNFNDTAQNNHMLQNYEATVSQKQINSIYHTLH